MYATLEPEHFMLEPYGSRKVSVSVRVHDGMPAGSHEKTQVRFFPEGSSTDGQTISVYTLRKLEHPYIFHTADKWKEVAANIEKEEIFHPGFEKLKLDADGWDVPLMVPFGERDYCYDTIQERYLMHCAYLYSITKNPAYAKKCRVFPPFCGCEDGISGKGKRV